MGAPRGMRRVCIVTPGQIGSNPRVVKEAQALHDAGYDVSVIATRALDFVEPRDLAIMRGVPWQLERIDLTSRLRWRLLRTAQLCAQHIFMATSLPRSADVGLSAITRPLLRAALGTPANLYIAHYPAALPAVVAAASKYRALYAYDAEDFHLGDWSDEPAFDTERRLVREIEGRHLPGCAYVTAAAPGIAEAYAEAYGIGRPRVVLNAFPLSQACPQPTPSGRTHPGPSLYWFSQTIGPHRGLECAVQAIGLARTRPHLYLRGTPAVGYPEMLLRLAESVGAGGRVHLLPPEDPHRMEQLATAYDLGLVSETAHTVSRRLCLTNKLFSFLLAGIPPLLSATPAHCNFAAEAGLANLLYPPEDSTALAQLLDRLLDDASQLAANRMQAWRLGQERYNWDREQARLLTLVERIGLPAVATPLAASAVRDADLVPDRKRHVSPVVSANRLGRMPTLKSHIGRAIIPMLPVNRRTFDIVRYELRAFRTRMVNAINPLYHARVQRLRRQRGLSLNIGSGGRGLASWVNVELTRHSDTSLCIDIRRDLPLASNSVRRILIEHVLEHVDFTSDVPLLLREFHRVLQPDGILRIVVPDAERFLKAYVSRDPETWRELGWDIARLPHDIFTPMHVINHVFHQGGEHLFAYDFDTLKFALKEAGFDNIKRMSFRKSADSDVAIDQPVHAPYSLYVEATKSSDGWAIPVVTGT